MERHVYAHETVAAPYSQVRELFERHPSMLIDPHAGPEGVQLEAQLAARVLGADIHRDVEITFGPFRAPSEGVCYRELEWAAATMPHLHPRLVGELEGAELGANDVQVSLIGHYRPPVGPLGDLGDAMGMHRLADQSIEILVLRIAANLEQIVAARTS